MSAVGYGDTGATGHAGREHGDVLYAGEKASGPQLRAAVKDRLPDDLVDIERQEWYELGRRSREYGLSDRDIDDVAYNVALRVFDDWNKNLRALSPEDVEDADTEGLKDRRDDGVTPVSYGELEDELERYAPEEPLLERAEETIRSLV